MQENACKIERSASEMRQKLEKSGVPAHSSLAIARALPL
jgi:hypothetical protein